jgi:hypothetical protein
MAAKALRSPSLLVPFVRALPLLAVFALTWSCGEALGYATGRPPRRLTIEREDSTDRRCPSRRSPEA